MYQTGYLSMCTGLNERPLHTIYISLKRSTRREKNGPKSSKSPPHPSSEFWHIRRGRGLNKSTVWQYLQERNSQGENCHPSRITPLATDIVKRKIADDLCPEKFVRYSILLYRDQKLLCSNSVIFFLTEKGEMCVFILTRYETNHTCTYNTCT